MRKIGPQALAGTVPECKIPNVLLLPNSFAIGILFITQCIIDNGAQSDFKKNAKQIVCMPGRADRLYQAVPFSFKCRI